MHAKAIENIVGCLDAALRDRCSFAIPMFDYKTCIGMDGKSAVDWQGLPYPPRPSPDPTKTIWPEADLTSAIIAGASPAFTGTFMPKRL
jgi:hypothetical protein